MDEKTIYTFQLESIITALQITARIHDSHKGTTCHDRCVREALAYAKNALKDQKDTKVNYMTGSQE